MDETQRLVLKGLTSDIITLGKNVEHLHVENKEKLIVVSDIAKHLILTESKVEAVSYTHLTLPTIYSV